MIAAFYRYIDHALGQIRDLAPADATLIVVSDHGGGPLLLEHAFHLQLDVLLETLGLQTPDGGEVLTIDELYLHDKRIWLNLEAVEADGEIPLSDAASKAREVASRLRALRTDRDGILLVHGPEVRPGPLARPSNLYQVAPTVALALERLRSLGYIR